jgi:hypothetical protein
VAVITPAQWKDVVNITPLSCCSRRHCLSLAWVAILMGVLLRNQLQNLNFLIILLWLRCVLEHNLIPCFSIWCRCKRLPEKKQNNPQNQWEPIMWQHGIPFALYYCLFVCLLLELFGGNLSLACGELQVISGLTKSCWFYTAQNPAGFKGMKVVVDTWTTSNFGFTLAICTCKLKCMVPFNCLCPLVFVWGDGHKWRCLFL